MKIENEYIDVSNIIDIKSVDMFRFDLYLSSIINKMLIEFKQSVRYHLPSDIAELYSSHQAAMVGWHEILDKMIFAFSIQDFDNYIDEQTGVECPYDVIITDNKLEVVPKEGYTPREVIDYQNARAKIETKTRERIKEGRELFIKYYDNLWV